MHVKTKFLRLYKPVSLGDHIDDWRVCWLGGWDKCRVFFVVMVERAPNRLKLIEVDKLVLKCEEGPLRLEPHQDLSN
jgi:hypothetical protein